MADKEEEVEAVATLSKRDQRREKRKLLFAKKKEEKKKKQKADAPKRAPVELDMSDEAVQRRKERQIAKRESFLMATEEGTSIVIDCGFEEEMKEREKKSLSQQIMFSYGVNRRSKAPAKAYITSLRGDTKQNLEKISGFDQWQAFAAMSECYMDVFKHESLVYLTADSPNTITTLEKDKVYIIGGIVDRNRLKGSTWKKAMEQGIQTARLPLDSHIDMGSATRVLTVNHVFEILVRYSETKDWKEATLATLPNRKNVKSKEEVES